MNEINNNQTERREAVLEVTEDALFDAINEASKKHWREEEAARADRERKRAAHKALKESDRKLLLAAIILGFTSSGVLGFLLGMGYTKAVGIAMAAIFIVLMLGEAVFGRKKHSEEER